MRVRHDHLPEILVAVFVPKGPGKTDKQPLRPRESIDRWADLPFQAHPVSAHGNADATKVPQVFTQGELAIEREAFEGSVSCILIDQARGAPIELGPILVRPPVSKPAVAVEATALVIKRMADLVADYRADCAVVHRVIRFYVEKRRLQDGRREDDFIARQAVIGVDALWRKGPFLAVDGIIMPQNPSFVFSKCNPFQVTEQVVRSDTDRVSAPPARVTDFARYLA